MRERGQEVFYAPEQISAFVLEELREAAQLHFGPDKLVADAVITVPAYFTDGQKQVHHVARPQWARQNHLLRALHEAVTQSTPCHNSSGSVY